MKKALTILATLLLAVLIFIPLELFFIGSPADSRTVYCNVTEEDGGQLRFHATTPASAIAFRGWKFRQEGNALHITARKVLVSRFFPSGTYTTTVTPEVLTEIYFAGERIWTAE